MTLIEYLLVQTQGSTGLVRVGVLITFSSLEKDISTIGPSDFVGPCLVGHGRTLTSVIPSFVSDLYLFTCFGPGSF